MSDIAAVGEKRVFEPFDKEAFKKEILNNIKYLFRNSQPAGDFPGGGLCIKGYDH